MYFLKKWVIISDMEKEGPLLTEDQIEEAEKAIKLSVEISAGGRQVSLGVVHRV